MRSHLMIGSRTSPEHQMLRSYTVAALLNGFRLYLCHPGSLPLRLPPDASASEFCVG